MGPRLVGGREFHNQSCISSETPTPDCPIGVYVIGVSGIGSPGVEKRCPLQLLLRVY